MGILLNKQINKLAILKIVLAYFKSSWALEVTQGPLVENHWVSLFFQSVLLLFQGRITSLYL